MTRNRIPIEVKRSCVELREKGLTTREIYDSYFKHHFDKPTAFSGFDSMIRRWEKKGYPDDETLAAGTYNGFIAHDATVQVSADGEIVQAWIKQKATDVDPAEFIEAIEGKVEPYTYIPVERNDSHDMLEIPLFDMHWGVAFLDHYQPVLNSILELITSRNWDTIFIPFGQDFFHNDSVVNGQTTKGTIIEKVDMKRAVKEGQRFMYAIVDTAICHANNVKVLYSPGNHDRSISWMFMQVLLERYGADIVDDSMEFRKCINYGKNTIMITHGDSKQATPRNLASIFPVAFAEQFAKANIREVHAGHLHSESDTDIHGIMVRRLSSGNKTDEWSDKEDYVGTHKRFMLFDWSFDKLKSIHYI